MPTLEVALIEWPDVPRQVSLEESPIARTREIHVLILLRKQVPRSDPGVSGLQQREQNQEASMMDTDLTDGTMDAQLMLLDVRK